MAVKLRDVVEKMQAIITADADADDRPRDKSAEILELAAGFLVPALAGESHRGQVAILMIPPGLEQLTFVYPKHLADGNVLPIDSNSFAGRVALGKDVLVENNVPDEPHKDFFERIPDPDGGVRPIQKMIASPLIDGAGPVIGVVEVCRTSSDRPVANFTPRDAANLRKCCDVFAPFIARVWTQQ